MTYVRRFGSFLYDFLVGDAWELFVGPLLGLLVAWLLVGAGLAPGIVGLALVAAVVVVAAVSISLGLRASD